jgi:hypothetical protein
VGENPFKSEEFNKISQVTVEDRRISWSPLINKDERVEAKDYGYSFGSKKVNMGPAFVDLRVMNQCLARAIMKHLDFSRGNYLFLEDLQKD